MEAVPQTLVEYQTSDGKKPFRDWLNSLRDKDARAKIRTRLIRIRMGNFGDTKPLESGVSEIRIDHGPGYRVYFARRGNTVVLLLCGGDKSRQKQDINRAKSFWLDYKRRSS